MITYLEMLAVVPLLAFTFIAVLLITKARKQTGLEFGPRFGVQ